MRFSATRLFLASLGLAMAGLFLSSIAFGQQDQTPFQKGVAAFNGGEYDQAIADFTQAIQVNPQYAEAYFRRAFVYMTTGNDDHAIADLNQAIQINPQYAQAYFRRAFVYMIKGNYEQAVLDLNRDIQIEPKNTRAYFRRANACMMMGNYDQAIMDLNQVIQIDPKFAQAYTKRCFIYILKGDYAPAIVNLNQIIQANPKNANAHNLLAWLLATCPLPSFRDGGKAVENATAACELTQWKRSGQLDTLAAAYAETGNFTNAVKWENQAISSQTDKETLNAQRSRLALYQSYHPYHVEKYDPKLAAVIN